MSDQDARWQELQDALAVGDVDAIEADVDERAEPQWCDELDFYAELAEHAQGEAVPASNDASIIDAALAAVPVAPSNASRAPIGWVAAVVVLAAVVAMWFFIPEGVKLRGADGTWATEAGDTVASGELIPSGTWLKVSDEACMAHGNAELCAAAGARLRVKDADAHALELAEGSIRVESGTWSVVTGEAVHMLTAGDSLEAPAEQLAKAELPTPKPPPAVEPVVVPEAAGDTGDAPDQPAVAKPKPVRPRADAATLVARARKARGEGRLGDAEKSYAELLRRFPKSSEAEAGRVALAQIKLRRGKSKAALRLFTTAARGGGPLAEEAAWGRIQALDKLGRKDDLRNAVDAFVAKYPTSVYRARAQGRLNP